MFLIFTLVILHEICLEESILNMEKIFCQKICIAILYTGVEALKHTRSH